MADIPAKIDSNFKKTLTAVEDNAGAEIKRLLVDPSTGRLKVSATISGGALTGSGTANQITFWSGGSALSSSGSFYWSGGSLFLKGDLIPPTANSYSLGSNGSAWGTIYTKTISVGSATLESPDLTASRIFGFPDASGTFNLTSRTINTTAPITGGGNLTADRTFAIPVATSSANGYLTSTDWTTFNNKATSEGTVYLGGSGTVNYIAKWSSGSALTTSKLWESGGSLSFGTTTGKGVFSVGSIVSSFEIMQSGFVGIGTTSPGFPLTVASDASAQAIRVWRNDNTVGNGVIGFALALNNASGVVTDYADIRGEIVANTAGTESGDLRFVTRNAGALTEWMRVRYNGNIGIGTTTPNVFKLQVNGNVGPDLTTNNLGSVGTPWSTTFTGSLSATSGGTLQGTFLAGTGLTMPAFLGRGIITPANTNDLGSTGSAFGSAFTTNLRVGANAYFTSEYSVGSTSTGTAINWNANGNKQYIGVNANATLSFGTPFGPCNLILRTSQENKTGGVITWPSNVRWSGGSALSTGSNKIDVVAFYFDNSFYWGQLATNFTT